MNLPELKRMRAIGGLTQDDLSRELKISLRTVQNWEYKEDIPDNKLNELYSIFRDRLELFASSPDVNEFLLKISGGSHKVDESTQKELKRVALLTRQFLIAIYDGVFVASNREVFTLFFGEFFNYWLEHRSKGSVNDFAKAIGMDSNLVDGLLSGKYPVTSNIILSLQSFDKSIYDVTVSLHDRKIIELYNKFVNSSFTTGLISISITDYSEYGYKHKSPDFLNTLKRYNIPGSPYTGEKFRLFQADGEYETIPDSTWVVAEQLTGEPLALKAIIKQDRLYAIVVDYRLFVGVNVAFHKDAMDGKTFIFTDESDTSGISLESISEIWEIKKKLQWSNV
jgi:transcriptional regulator with XRE-family HTH domain